MVQLTHILRYNLLLIASFVVLTAHGQSSKKDRTIANKYFLDARIFRADGAYEQSNSLLRAAMQMYADMGMWVRFCGTKKTLISNFEVTEQWDSVRILQEELLKESVRYLGKNNRFEKQGYITLGEAYIHRNQPDFALPFLEEGLGMIDGNAIGKEEEKTKIYTLLGMAYELKSEHKVALLHFEKAKTLVESNKVFELPVIAQWNYTYAKTLFHSQQFDKAQVYAEKSLAANQALYTQNSRKTAESFILLAEIQAALGKFEASVAHLKNAVRILSLHKSGTQLLVEAYRKKGAILAQAGKYIEAEASIKLGINASLKTFGKKHPETADCYLTMAMLNQSTGNTESGLDYINRGMLALLPYNESLEADLKTAPILSSPIMLHLLLLRQQILNTNYAKNKQPSDLEAIIATASTAEQLRKQIQSEYFNLYMRYEIERLFYEIYTAAIAAQLQLAAIQTSDSGFQNYYQALAWAERAKQYKKRSLLFINTPLMTSGLSKKMKAEEINLLKSLTLLKYKMTHSTDPIALAILKSDWAAHLKKFDQWLAVLKQQTPAYYQCFYETPNISVGDLQSKLKDGKRLLVFLDSKEAYYRFWMDDKTLHVKSLPKSKESKESLRWLCSYLADATAAKEEAKLAQFGKESAKLYTLLLGDLMMASDTTIHHLNIVADGDLALLPFELLLSSPPEGKATQWPYLLRHSTISYFWTVGDLLRTPRETSGKRLLLANTNYKNLPALREMRELYKMAQIWSLQGTGNKYRRRFKGKFQLNLEATERNVTQNEFNTFAVFQPALYSDFSEQDPMLARLLLSYEKDSLFDGVWYAYEVSNLSIPVQLLVLSGVGDSLLLNDSKMALLLAFEYSGAEATLWSLWRQNEADERKIIQLYYENLAAGLSKTKALRQAKIDFLESNEGLKAAPHYWASFMLNGIDGFVAMETRNRFPWIPVSIGAIILLGIIILWLRKKR